ncbi:Rap1a/Tai family immunity protein [Burkholderia sp. Bp9031]|uniref:Rap1a/Tai family immunity protein n=1 Tax=Burkholderia sp. Bp9031 TaxID=2184566 RepID=UPI0039089021
MPRSPRWPKYADPSFLAASTRFSPNRRMPMSTGPALGLARVIYEMATVLICPLPNSLGQRHEALSCQERVCFRVVVRKYRQRNRGSATACGRRPSARRPEPFRQQSVADAERHAMAWYLAGVSDATEGKDWCDNGRVKPGEIDSEVLGDLGKRPRGVSEFPCSRRVEIHTDGRTN